MKVITVLVAAGVAALINTASANEVSCKAGFVLLHDTCIQVFHHTKLTWEEASTTCKSLDNFAPGSPHLAHINDCSLLSSLWDYVHYQLGLSEDLWLGGSDSMTEDSWEWENGDPIPEGVPFWHPIQPDGDTLENKLVFAHNGYFADGHEEVLYGYICQYMP